jgi:hypothetical protein
MLEIKNTSGLTLQLQTGQKLTIEINSTIFDTDDIIRGSYSYPFKFPLNDNNRKFIAHGHLPESPLEPDLQVHVRAGAHAFVATLTYKTSGKYADAALLIDLGELADKIRNVPVREFVTERFFFYAGDDLTRTSIATLAYAEPNTYPIVFPPFHNEDMVEADFKPTANYQRPLVTNFWHVGNPLPASSGVHLGSGDRLLVPMVYVCWLISYICTKLGFAASGTLFTDPLLSRLIIFNTQTMPGMDTTTGGYTVEVGRHLGDYSISEFFKSLRSYIGLSIDINVTAKKAVFNTYKSLSQEPKYTDLSSCVVPGTVGVEKSGVTGFTVKTFEDANDKYVRYVPFVFDNKNIQPKELKTTFSFNVGDNAKDLPLSVGTLRMDSFKSTSDVTNAGPNWLLPAAKQAGNLADPFFEKSANYSPYFDANDPDKIPPAKNPWGLRMLIYWGNQQDTAGNFYPYASSVSYNSKYEVFGGLSLLPGEPDDIWQRYQKPYYEFLAYAKKITVLMKLTVSKLSDISTSVPVGFKLGNFVLGRYLLESMKYELPAPDGHLLAEIEVRQSVPKLLRAQSPLDSKLINTWIQLKLENPTIIPNGNNSRNTEYVDIVAYIWKDGLFTTPETQLGFNCEYRKCTTDYDTVGGNKKVCTKESVYISGHRTVIETQVNSAISGNPQGLIKWVTWAMLDGEGYRAR